MFKVGDVVTIKTGLKAQKKYDDIYFVYEMVRHLGKEATITHIYGDGSFSLDIDDGLCIWTKSMVEQQNGTYRHWERNLNNAV